MLLTKIEIENYRSIKYAAIEPKPSCLVLVGINESGKSNILKAISSLGDYLPGVDEIREAAPDEEPVERSRIRFHFSLSKAEREELYDQVEAQVFYRGKRNPVQRGSRSLSLRDFVELRSNGVYNVDIQAKQKQGRYWVLPKNEFKLLPGWKKPSQHCPEDAEIEPGRPVGKSRLIYAPDFPGFAAEYLEDASVEDFSALVGHVVASFIASHLPPVLLWQYTPVNLLPSSISLAAFAQRPETCIPLRNMFHLAGVLDIQESIADLANKTHNQTENFFSRIAKKTTAHFRSIWREYKSVQFELRPEGDNLVPGIREENVFDFSQRSDGFKRFVSFLLLVSADVKSGTLTDSVLLVDEPDISLHPSGARYLRDELIKISKTNLVLYSTHSTFMIDKQDIHRHLIVSKQKEQTRIAIANDSNFLSEEVLYNALGTTIFEALQERNLIFEGWKDKQLFEVAMERIPSSHRRLKDKFKSIGLCYSKGVKDIRYLTPIVQLAKRHCVVVSDGDEPACQKQREFQEDRLYGDWFRYDQLLDGLPRYVTSEDFIKFGAFESVLNDIALAHSLKHFDDGADPGFARLTRIERWLAQGGIQKDQRKTLITSVKDTVSANLKNSHVESNYYDVLVSAMEKIESSTLVA